MLGFSRYLVESVFLTEAGASTARQGHANEIFTNDFVNAYAKAFNKHSAAGKSEEESHANALKEMRKIKYDHEYHMNRKDLEPKTAAQIRKSVNELGPDYSAIVHENSKNSAEAPISYLRQKYGARVLNSIHSGAGQAAEVGNADVVFNLSHKNKKKLAGALLEHDDKTPEQFKYGQSLKYSSAEKEKETKIHSPGVDTAVAIIDEHHRRMFGTDSGIAKNLIAAKNKGQQAQREAVLGISSGKKTHHEFLSSMITKVKADAEKAAATGTTPKFKPPEIKDDDEWIKKVRKAKYEPVIDKKTGSIKGADFDDKNFLSVLRRFNESKAKIPGIDKEAAKRAYGAISNENLKMKGALADAIHKPIQKILSHSSSDLKEQKEIDAKKHDFHRDLLNIHEPTENKLPTMLVKTQGDGAVHVADSNEAFAEHYGNRDKPNSENVSFNKKTKGSSTFRLGASTAGIDSRPGTMHNPLKNTINFTVPPSFFAPVTKTYAGGKFDKQIQPAEENKQDTISNSKSKLPYNRPGAGRVPQTDSPMAIAPKPGITKSGITIDADAEHGGTQFYAPHEKNLMKGL